MSWTVESFARLELCVNNAGVARRGGIESLPLDDWREVIDVNLHGVYHGVRAAGRAMLAQGGGAIVNIASIAAERGAAGRSAYCASKAAVVALTRTAAVEWAARGVRVNAVSPGYAGTALLRTAIDEGSLREEPILQRIPARRLGEPGEIAAAVAFLASEEASYITGQVLSVDGGFLADYGIALED